VKIVAASYFNFDLLFEIHIFAMEEVAREIWQTYISECSKDITWKAGAAIS
jgi:hypothetical protein